MAFIAIAILSLEWARAQTAETHGAQGLLRARAELSEFLPQRGLSLGAPAFIRIFKETKELEVWLRRASDGAWVHFRTYPICDFSGVRGPKVEEGDGQSPEGLYEVRHDQLHPESDYHLAFNLGFPNAYDRAHGRTGSGLMVHGDCTSVGCYAMTDRGIEEIYALVEAALNNGQASFWVHAFPARLTDDWLARRWASPWIDYWRDLKPCYDLFEAAGRMPRVMVAGARYHCW